MAKHNFYSMDIETHDPHLMTKGMSWQWGDGEILVIGFYDAQKDTNVAYKWDKKFQDFLRKILSNPNNTVINSNIKYDLLWCCSMMKMPIHEVKAEIICTQITEFLIDPFADYAHEDLCLRYLKQLKGKDKLEIICAEHKLRGDFRSHLKKLIELGYEKEVNNYCLSDSKQPYFIHLKQMDKLKCPIETFNIYQKINLISAQMQYDGVKVDYAKWKKNAAIVADELEKLRKNFEKKYGDFNINSPAQVGKFLMENDYDTQFKITIRGFLPKGDQKFSKSRDGFTIPQRKAAAEKLQSITTAFQFQKDKLWIEVGAGAVEAFQKLIAQKFGYETIANPLTGKTQLEGSDNPCVKDFMQYKQVSEMKKKFFGSEFEKYFSNSMFGDWRIHANFQPVGARTTGRFSCVKPNLQNIPVKVVLYEGTKKEINVSAMAREIFIPEKNHVMVKMDYSGQELRMAAHFAIGDDGEYIRQLYKQNKKLDEHQIVIDNTDLVEKHGSNARKYAKNIRFGLAYGASVKRIAQMNNWTYEDASILVDTIKEASPWMEKTRAKLIKDLSQGKISGTTTILRRLIPLKSADKAYAHYNYLIQGSCADQLKAAMVLVWDYVTKIDSHRDIKFALTVHDEIVLSIKKNFGGVKKIKLCLENAIESEVPFITEPETGLNWNDTKPLKDKTIEDEEDYE